MGERGGYLKYRRMDALHLEASDRINHWDEFYVRQNEENIRRQAARCMECGTPFCHTGDSIGGITAGCPLHNLIPEWNDLIFRGLWKEAYERLSKRTDFPEFTGRVCPALCEGSCTAGLNGDPVTIKNNEKELAEKAFEEGWAKAEPPEFRTGKRVAVIGSGPAGLSCALKLNRAGHSVTVFEKADRPGGLLMYGIPNMKLDKQKVVLRRIALMEEEGIEFRLNTDAGKDISAKELMTSFDAVVICAGARKPRDTEIQGRTLGGIYFAVDYLASATKKLFSNDMGSPVIDAKGKDVVVIGGGDTGTDCVATAIRQGAKSVVQLEIMQKPPECRQPGNPWPEWPRILKVDYGHEEAAAVFGGDPRVYLSTATEFIGDAGNISAVIVDSVEWIKNSTGKYYPAPRPDERRVLPAQLVLLAMGFTGPEDYMAEAFGLEKDPRGNIKTGADAFSTAVPGIFAAGDARRGQSLVVWAMHEGRRAAAEINEYLCKTD